ncbi:hypothetical protein ACQKWADRAFT_328219 [Trichoderma austrokoningii]
MSSHNLPSWVSLPAEIRLQILESIAHEKPYGWSSLASICKEWQYVFEKENYKKLKVRSSRLGQFESMVPLYKRHFIRHIWFDIELPRYKTRCCSRRCSSVKNMGRTVTKAIRKIYSILSTWKADNGLTLELNVVSPTDREHWFSNWHFSTDFVEDGDDEKSATYHDAYQNHDDPDHGWVHGTQLEAPSPQAVSQLLYPVQLEEFDSEPLPVVKAVTQLVIRRQLRRRILSFSLAELLSKLPCLESIVYEPWISTDSWMVFDDEYLSQVIQHQLPPSVQRLVMFRESTTSYDESLVVAGQANRTGHRDSYDTAFALKSLELHHLAASFIIDAEHMFQLCQPTWTWLNLETLSLTSQLLQKNDDENRGGDLEGLICRAAQLVRQMPKLKTLVLWNGEQNNACAFIYSVERNGYPFITWRGTWDLEMSQRIIEAWREVASRFPTDRLGVRREHIGETIGSHADAIYYLRLPLQVVEPESLWQMRRETRSFLI